MYHENVQQLLRNVDLLSSVPDLEPESIGTVCWRMLRSRSAGEICFVILGRVIY